MAPKFHERFEIEVGVQEARRRFAARVANLVFERFLTTHFNEQWNRYQAEKYIASVIGDRHVGHYLDAIAGTADFHRHMQAVEALHDYVVLDAHDYGHAKRDALNTVVRGILEMSEVDIGVRWEGGRFIPEGARLLDDKLVNEPLRWLNASGYENVLAPFRKGLQHLLQSQKTPELLADVVTDMYEALEALAKAVTGRDADLSANQELLIKQLKATDGYKRLLKNYVEYANEYRHGAEKGTVRPPPSPAETESFVYLTGMFIRLAMR